MLAVAFLAIVPGRFDRFSHKYAILAVEVLTAIFWFAGWIALAVFLGDIGCGTHGSVCGTSEAATVFAAIEWYVFQEFSFERIRDTKNSVRLLFMATTVMAFQHVYNTRNSSSGTHDRNMEVHQTSV